MASTAREKNDEAYSASFDADGNLQEQDAPEVVTEGEEDDDESNVEVVDDTPEEDRGKEAMPEDIVKELEEDELEAYDAKTKQRLKQLKKVWHDERRAKEKALREAQEAVAATSKVLQDLNAVRTQYSWGEQQYAELARRVAEAEALNVEKDYRDAFESGDTDRIIDAQKKLTDSQYRVQQAGGFTPSLQTPQPVVHSPPQQLQAPQPDERTLGWQKANGWFGTDAEMTASALGLHRKLFDEKGASYIGTDEYYAAIDNTMRRRFPEYFGGDEDADAVKPAKRRAKASTVVAPASRSRAARTVVLTQTQVDLARRLGITPEAYAKEMLKLESN